MGRKSTVRRLPPEIFAAVEEMVASGRATIDEIVTHIKGMGGDVSRSAVGRFKQRHETQLARYREAQEVAGVWSSKFAENPESDVGLLLQQMLSTIAFQSLVDVETLDPKDVMFLGKALKDLAGAQKLSLEMVQKALARRQAQLEAQAKAAAAEMETTAKSAGLSDDTVEKMRAILMGAIQ